MIFEITEKVRLAGTEREWQLQRLEPRKRKGVPTLEWRPFRFYRSLSAALRACADYDFRMAESWDDLDARITRLEALAAHAESNLAARLLPPPSPPRQ